MIRILVCCVLLAGIPVLAGDYPFFPMHFGFQKKTQAGGVESTLVRVRITTRFQGTKDVVAINGRQITDSSPLVIQSFSSTGIVIDDKGHIMTYLGLRWLDIHDRETSIEVSRQGQKWKGKLIGIDQKSGIAVVRLAGGKLKKTPTCDDCEVKDGATVMAPVSHEISKMRRAQIVSFGNRKASPESGSWTITLDRPFPDIWQPILTSDGRVLGFMEPQDPMGISNVVYPVAQLLESAEQIIKNDGDIFAGWLGLYVLDINPTGGTGVFIQQVEPDSPARDAGLTPGDILLRYNGIPVADSVQFIQLVENTPVGSKASIEIVRQGSPMTLRASVQARKPQKNRGRVSLNLPAGFGLAAPGAIPAPFPRNQRLLIGVETLLLQPALSRSLEIPVQNGVLVVDIQKDSPAERAGVLIGDVILAIDGEAIIDGLAFSNFLQTHPWGREVLLRINRKGAEITLPVHLAD